MALNPRDITLTGQWAAEAQTNIPNPPIPNISYRNTSLAAAEVKGGQAYSAVYDSAKHNQVGFEVTGLVMEAEKYGTMRYSPLTDYPLHGRCVGLDDGLVYRAIQPSGPNNGGVQTTDNAAYWIKDSSEFTGLPGLVHPFSGTFGGTGNKHPIDKRTGQSNTAYALCDGGTYQSSDGRSVTTPDLRDKFILGAGVTYSAGNSGGGVTKPVSATTLTTAQMPSHSHGLLGGTGGARSLHDQTPYILGAESATISAGQGATIAYTGNGESHTHTVDVLPPYYALAYIMQL